MRNWKKLFVLVFFTAAATLSQAQIEKVLVNFDWTNGASPGGLVQGVNGTLYGSTTYGESSAFCPSGAEACPGSLFEITPAGTLKTLYIFCSLESCTDGYYPSGTLLLGTNGNLYGTASAGGANGGGTVFKITPAGELTTLYNFCSAKRCVDGATPRAALIQGTDGNFYGTTFAGGDEGDGTVFKMTPAGKLTRLYSFCALPNCADGQWPSAGLVQARNGNFYGVTVYGGANNNSSCSVGCGTIFEITAAGVLTTVYNFCSQASCTDGWAPEGGLTQAPNGNFYGTTSLGGSGEACGGFLGCGTVFEMTAAGGLTTLYNFCIDAGCPDGFGSTANMIQGSDGSLYGTTSGGGGGSAFRITLAGQYKTLFGFCEFCLVGSAPGAPVVQATNGIFYGTTGDGGTSVGLTNCFFGCGVVFSLETGLAPFVEPVPTSGAAGASVLVLGNNLSGSTAVSFNGTAASFTVTSPTEIKTTVPAGATTGRITVTTATGTLTSNVAYAVAP